MPWGRSRPAWGEDVEPLSYPRVAVSALSSCGVAPVDSAERLSDRRVVVVVLSSFVGRTGPWVDDPDGGMGNLRGHLYCAGVGRRCMRVDRTVTIGAFHDGRRLWRSGRRSGNGEGEELSVSEHCGAVVSSVSCVGGPGAVPCRAGGAGHCVRAGYGPVVDGAAGDFPFGVSEGLRKERRGHSSAGRSSDSSSMDCGSDLEILMFRALSRCARLTRLPVPVRSCFIALS